MKVPAKVNILGQEFKIVFKPDKEMKNCIGYCVPHKNRIDLQDDLTDDRLGEVFLHEVIHAIETNLNLKMTENQVNGLGVGLYQFFRANPSIKFRKTNVKDANRKVSQVNPDA